MFLSRLRDVISGGMAELLGVDADEVTIAPVRRPAEPSLVENESGWQRRRFTHSSLLGHLACDHYESYHTAFYGASSW